MASTSGTLGGDDGPFAIETLTATGKSTNPIGSWMRLGGFDFFMGYPCGRGRIQGPCIKRMENHGSDDCAEHELKIDGAEIRENKIIQRIPDLAHTRGMEISCVFESGIKRVIHASIHHLP